MKKIVVKDSAKKTNKGSNKKSNGKYLLCVAKNF